MDIIRVDKVSDENEDHAAVIKYRSPKDGRITHYLTGSVGLVGEAVFLKSEYGEYDDEHDALNVAREFAEKYGLDRVYLVDRT